MASNLTSFDAELRPKKQAHEMEHFAEEDSHLSSQSSSLSSIGLVGGFLSKVKQVIGRGSKSVQTANSPNDKPSPLSTAPRNQLRLVIEEPHEDDFEDSSSIEIASSPSSSVVSLNSPLSSHISAFTVYDNSTAADEVQDDQSHDEAEESKSKESRPFSNLVIKEFDQLDVKMSEYFDRTAATNQSSGKKKLRRKIVKNKDGERKAVERQPLDSKSAFHVLMQRIKQFSSHASDGERKEFWMRDEVSRECYQCKQPFTAFRRRHHCRICGKIAVLLLIFHCTL
jgi:hypothetical protein